MKILQYIGNALLFNKGYRKAGQTIYITSKKIIIIANKKILKHRMIMYYFAVRATSLVLARCRINIMMIIVASMQHGVVANGTMKRLVQLRRSIIRLQHTYSRKR